MEKVVSTKKLRLGLDIGTNSVGYALLDENNKLVKKNGHTFWGVRMFEEAKTAKDRGGYRKGRRRLARRKERVNIIRNLFSKEIYNVDKTFFERLDDSFYYKEDKRNLNVYNLFTDTYTDKDFYHDYPTIFHLRKAMMNEDKKFDIRMLYLVISHIVKYRGNFLYSGEEFSTTDFTSVRDFFDNFNNVLAEIENEFDENEDFDAVYTERITNIDDEFFLKLQNIIVNVRGISNKKTELLKLFSVNKKSIYNELIIPLLAGTIKVNVSNLSIVKANKYPKVETSLASEELESQIEEAITTIPELKDIFDMILEVKAISDFYFINKILSGSNSISEAMVKIYDAHASDLDRLQNFIRKYDSKSFNEIFRTNSKDLNNYPAYIGFNNVHNNPERFKHSSREDFYAYIKKKIEAIKNVESEDEKKYFLDKIDDNDFLLRQNSNQNGAFPMQLHLSELKQILNNQAKYYPFLNEIEDGYSVKDKIILTFKYKIPYYVGPLNKESEYSWVVRSNDKIYPWNFDKVVNIDETAQKFILRMQNKCSYLKGDNYCLPKNSLLFSEYNCLNYLNKLQINGKVIDYEVKMKLFNDLFLKEKQPTKKRIVEYLKANYGDVTTTTSKEIPEVTCNMASYIKMKEIFKDSFEDRKEDIENIIKDITMFEDKSILEKRLEKIYKLDKEKIKQIKGLNYKDYGRLSKKLLSGIQAIDPSTGEVKGTVIEIMRKTNLNLQEILYLNNYRLIDEIDKYNEQFSCDSTQTVEDYIEDNLIISPSFKRSLIQSFTIIEEIERIFHRKIDEYYVEVTRTNKDKRKNTTSRYDKIKDLFKNCNELASYNVDITKLDSELDSKKNELKSDILFLYFTQLGKCMYSLENIDINDLATNYKYDIDHIYPQSIIKDDSLNNRVLVNKTKNAKKTDNFLFDSGVLNPKAEGFYKKLLDLDLITKEKYRRLTQKEMSQEELDGFVNRQLVSTNQSVKGLIQLLKDYHNVDEKNIIYSKGENVSDFRNLFKLIKSRTANNFHHAHDAYLNVVVGGILNKYYSSRRFYEFKDLERIKNENESINPERLFQKKVLYANNKVIWNRDENIARIKHDLYKRFDINETYKTYNPNEMYSKVTILPKGNEGSVPFQTTTPRSDVIKYGGITSNKFSRYVIVEALDKKGKLTILEAIPKTACSNEHTLEKDITNYLSSLDEYKKYISFKVVNFNIKANVVIEDGNLKYIITGKTGNQYVLQNVLDRFFSYNAMTTIKKIDKYLENEKMKCLMDKNEDSIIVSPKRKKYQEIILTKNELNELLKEIKTIYSKNIYSFSAMLSIVDNIDISKVFKIEELITLCNNLLQLLKTNERKSSDLSLIGMSKNSGTFYLGKKLKPGMKFVWESITCYYKKVIYEVK